MADQISVVGTVILMMIVDFKKIAVEFKRLFGLDSTQKFPALSIAENKLCMADEHFEFNVVADLDWNYKDSVQAYYRHSENRHEIGIKESVYENIADLLTTLLVFSEAELSQAHCAKDLDLSSCMSETQFSLAHFYCQNHEVLTENFIKNIVPTLPDKIGETRRRLVYA